MSRALPPEPGRLPGLDSLFVRMALRDLSAAAMYTATGAHPLAIVKARDASRTLLLVLAMHDRGELLEPLLADSEPRTSAALDTRPICQNCDKPAIDDEERCADCDHEHRAELDWQHRMEAQ